MSGDGITSSMRSNNDNNNNNNNISIEGIYTCPVASGDMVSIPTANLLEGVGMEGDRYAQRLGTYSVLQEPGRQLTLLSADGVEAALSEYNNLKLPSSTDIRTLRRNVVLRGISSLDLLNCIGSVIQLGSGGGGDDETGGGSAKVFVHRNCVPCMYNERKNQLPGMMEALWETGGVSCQVIESGSISVGDTVTILDDNDDANKKSLVATDGGKPTGFFVRPSKRSAEMVRGMLEGKKRGKEALMQTDKEGLLRLQQSYESVGLKY